jgi:branched-chain amino acid transport system permease protein
MNLWLTLTVNSVALGGVLFLLSSGFSLIFGLMRIPNLMHGSFFMLGAYLGVTLLARGINFWVAALASAAAMALIGGLIERFLLRRLEGQTLPQVLLTLGFAFIIADLCLMLPRRSICAGPCRWRGCTFRSTVWWSCSWPSSLPSPCGFWSTGPASAP